MLQTQARGGNSLLAVNGVSVHFGGIVALDGISFDIAPGQIAGLIGQSFLHRQTLERPALPAIALTHDAGLATFLAGDEQGSQLFSRQLRALASNQDTVMVLAGIHLSPADREALDTARQLGCRTVLIAGEQVELTDILPDINLSLPSDSLPRLQENVLFIGNLLCALVEGDLFGL